MQNLSDKSWYKVSAKIEMIDPERGKAKKITEVYFIEAVDSVDAQAKAAEDLDGETFEIVSIVKQKVTKVISCE